MDCSQSLAAAWGLVMNVVGSLVPQLLRITSARVGCRNRLCKSQCFSILLLFLQELARAKDINSSNQRGMFQNIVHLIERVDDEVNSNRAQPPNTFDSPGCEAEGKEEVCDGDGGLQPSESEQHTLTEAQLPPAASPLLEQHPVDDPAAASLTHHNENEENVAEKFSIRLAKAEGELQLALLKMSQLKRENESLQHKLQHQSNFVERVAAAAGRADAMEPLIFEAQTASYALRCEQDPSNVAASSTATRMLHTLQFHEETIANLRESNVMLRSQLTEYDMSWTAEREKLEAKVAELSDFESRFQELSKELEKKHEDAKFQQLTLSSLRGALGDTQRRNSELQRSVDDLKRTIVLMDEIQKTRGGDDVERGLASPLPLAPQSIKQSKVFHALERKWYGPAMQKTASGLDLVSSLCLTFLRRHVWVRIAVLVYMCLVHIYLFHMVSVFTHGMEHVGDDVHDHVKNHMK